MVLPMADVLQPSAWQRFPPPCAMHKMVLPMADLLQPSAWQRFPPPCALQDKSGVGVIAAVRYAVGVVASAVLQAAGVVATVPQSGEWEVVARTVPQGEWEWLQELCRRAVGGEEVVTSTVLQASGWLQALYCRRVGVIASTVHASGIGLQSAVPQAGVGVVAKRCAAGELERLQRCAAGEWSGCKRMHLS
ncbi:hypothetical protein CYMTET_29255, partial [Cymbomonas tetramitiformis]